MPVASTICQDLSRKNRSLKMVGGGEGQVKPELGKGVSAKMARTRSLALW